MLVFFKRLPKETRKSDIEAFIAAVVRGGIFSKRGEIKGISIIQRRNPQLNVTDYHAVVGIEPDNVAERVIKTLNKKMFKGKYIEVRQYYIRNAANDPRNKNRVFDEVPDSRRVRERRQKIEESSSASFVGVKDFHRKD